MSETQRNEETTEQSAVTGSTISAEETSPVQESSPSTSEQATTTSEQESSSTAPEFSSLIPEEYRDDPTLKDISDINALVKSYVSSQRMLGSSIRIPSEDASPEAKAEFLKKVAQVEGVVAIPSEGDTEAMAAYRAKMGIPETAEEYDIKLPQDIPPEVVDSDELTGFKQAAHSLGLNSKQVDALVQYDLQRQMKALDQVAEATEQGKASLKKIWGDDFDNRKAAAERMLSKYGEKYPEEVKQLLSTSVTQPLMYVMLAELGKINQERGHIQGGSNAKFGITPEEANEKIAEIRANRNDPYHDGSHPQHEARLEYMRKLYQLAHPNEGSE